MSQKDDLVTRLKSYPVDFTIRELDSLMNKCNCVKGNRGKSSGSAIEYIHSPSKRAFTCHSPHPQKELKRYVLKNVILFLQELGEI